MRPERPLVLDPALMQSLGSLRPGAGASTKDLESALADISAATAAGQPIDSLLSGIHRDMSAARTTTPLPLELKTLVAVRTTAARALDPLATWTRALRPRASRGPFVNGLGETFWIDTFHLPTLASLVVEHLSGQRSLVARLPVRGQLGAGNRLRLNAGTVWLPARMFASGRGANDFVAIRITGGTANVAGETRVDGGAVVLKGAWSLELRLNLDHTGEPVPDADADTDAARTEATLPRTATFVIGPQGLRSVAIPAISLTAYGTSLQLTPTDDRPFFDEVTRSVVVPLAADEDEFRFASVRSTVWKIDGAARIARSGWALSVATIDPNAVGEADNAGAAWVELDTPLALEWKGLPKPVKAPKTVLTVAPAKTLVWSTLNPADVRFALLLWNEAAGSPQRRSTLEFESIAGSVVVHISQPDLDGVIFNGRAIGHFDRPLAADGGRLAIRMPTAWYAVAEMATDTIVGVIGNDPKAQTRPHVAFALENAFIKARSPAWLHLSGPLNAAGIERGLLLLRFPFRFVLPTLPDPYASSVDVPVRTDVDSGWASASVVWPNLDAASLGFNVLPAEAQGALTTFNTQLVAGRGTAPTLPVLLDVSSNADQFGVAIPPASRTGSSLQVQGMSLVAEARHVAAITLPPISWEPMLTKTPAPGATGDVPLPPPPHDGGPALLTADVVELRPVEPVPLLRTYHEAIRDRRHFNARLPLPFGLIANLNSRGNAGDAAESQFKGTVFMNRPRFDGLTGGRQLALKGEPGVPQQRDPTMPGFLDAEMQDDYAKGVLSENLLTGVVTDFGRGKNGVPVRRYELSGYGASLFSDWRDPEAEGPAIIQARFDVLTGRTSHEVIQMQSALDPVHARVVRTITIDRQQGGWVLREDSGWQPTSDGLFVFKGDANAVAPPVPPGVPQPLPPAFVETDIHRGAVSGVVNIRNIRLNGAQFPLPSPDGAVVWQPVLYDADVLFATAANPRLALGAGSNGLRVPSRKLTGWIQISGPEYHTKSKSGDVISRVRPATGRQIADLLAVRGPAAAPIDAQLLLGGTAGEPGMQFHAFRMDVSCADSTGTPRLVASVRGSPALPRDGAWSLGRLGASDPAPKALDPNFPVPLVRPNTATAGNERWHLADPVDILQLADNANPTVRYGLVQSMGTQKVFFERPRVGSDPKPITLPKPPKLADVGALLNAAGIFPGLGDAFDFNAFDGFDITSGQLGFSRTFPILKGGTRASAMLADLGGSDAIQLVIDYEDEQNIATVATITVNPTASPRWSIALERVAFTVRFRGNPLIRMFARVKANEQSAPAIEDINVRYEGILQSLQTIFTNVQQVARYLPGGAGAGLRVAFSQGHLTIQNEFALPNLPLGAGQITDVAVAMGLDVSLSPFDVRFIAGLGSSPKPFRWIVSPLAGTGVVQVGIGAKGLDILVQCGIGVGLAIDLGIAAGSASVAIALELNTGPSPFEIRVILSGRASVDVLRGLASATITLAAGVGIIPPEELLKPPFLPPRVLPPLTEIPSFTVGLTASVSVGIHITVCWVVDVDFDGYWQFRQDIKTPAIDIPVI
jgi:hypothetical protein